MFALLVAAALARDTSDADFFKAAAYDASVAAGTSGFSSALTTAQFRCTGAVPGCDDEVERLQSLDAAARRPPAAVAEAEEEESAARVPSGPRVVYIDQPTSLDHVAAYGSLSEPWGGFKVRNLTVALPQAQMVCVLADDGIPSPIGTPVPFVFGHTRGTSPVTCPAATVRPGSVISVPFGGSVWLGVFDSSRQAYVVESAWVCKRRPNDVGSGSIDRTVTSCTKQAVR